MSEIAAELGMLRATLLRWLMDDALPLWWTLGADRARGGFHEAIDMTGAPVGAERRARVQARQIFSYATGGALGWEGPWRQAMAHGLSFFVGGYRRPDGLFWNTLDQGGQPVAEAPRLYEQAFALLALAAASGAPDPDPALEPVAVALADALSTQRRAAGGGFIGFIDERLYQSDPHMHVLEAALAWEDVAPAPRWTALADEVAELCLARFVTADGGALLEYFDAAWAPAQGLAGRLVWPGHLFEWAGLLERWGAARGRQDARAAARRLYRSAADHGVDPSRGVAIFELLDDLSLHDAKARLWAQTEWLKAALVMARAEPPGQARDRCLADAVAASRALLSYLDTPVAGLWRDKLRGDGTWVEEPAPASSFYHIVDAIRVLAEWEAA